MTASLLPNGKQQFSDANGNPLAAGQVYFYVPNTSPPVFKDTWADINQTSRNPNPITLDDAGEWVIWGSGVYRQVVYDVNGALIWDQLTSSGGEGVDSTTFYDFAVYMEGKPAAAELYPVFTIVRQLTLPAGLTVSQFSIQTSTLPTGAILITLQKNGVSIGTLQVSTAGVFTVNFPADVTFVPGDQFSILWPASQDATAGNISLTFAFTLG